VRIDAADLVRFLAYSGCRINEAANVKRDDVDLQAGTIRICGDPVNGTKNSESRTIPIIRPCMTFAPDYWKTSANRGMSNEEGRGICSSLPNAVKLSPMRAQRLECLRSAITILRHLFTTRAIEAQIPIPTVARWLGHKDGGALLMRTYSHLLDAHSKAMAQRMTF
jgi:integrase